MRRLVPLPWVLVLLLPYGWVDGAPQAKVTAVELKDVTVTQTPAEVNDGSDLVNLTCDASQGQGNATWRWSKGDFSTISRLLDGNTTLQINQPNKTHNGKYLCIMSNGVDSDWGQHILYVYYKVENVTVTPSSKEVIEGSTTSLNLTCNSSAVWEGSITWLWEGKPLNTANTSYSLLDGNQTVQINQPSRTHNGNYRCVIANPASSGLGEFTLRVSAPLSPGAIAGIVIGSVLGALLIICLIVLIVCCIRKRKGGKRKSPSGPKHKNVLSTVSGQEKQNSHGAPHIGYACWDETNQSSGGMGNKSSLHNNTPVVTQKPRQGTLV
ncbi:carcinoembryonic antigen-related cell adhesion molecule 1-like [Xenopus laevis]|uniref:Carcinoembryonic antigen-related cell adhesion molecule 1-like n=1 Tax=Xenopus laevis TaxID=8355 RepID=A0A8J1LG03_XENLA|nr:carcinoembryonic antigen-related cell adhesion molecule 1-like [Xenopus laevis]